MSLTSDDVKRVAKLARLGLTDVETTETLAQLNSILELVDQMQQIDTNGVAPLAHPLELRQTLRADAVAEPGGDAVARGRPSHCWLPCGSVQHR